VVGELQNYSITEAERDVLGDAFEVFIGPALKGPQGQFFTPRNVVKFAVHVLDPDSGNKIIDPACGSGGFLIVALEHVWNKIRKEAKKRGFDEKWIETKQKEIASKTMRGIDKDSFLTKVTKAYMAIVGDGRGGVFCENSLDPPASWHDKTKKIISLNDFEILLTNPPFGSKIPIPERETLEQLQLGHKWKKKQKGVIWEKTSKLHVKQPPQILFIERCLEFLKPKGRMIIVLPDGVLGGSKLGYAAYFIRKNAKILAVIDCPKETFQPDTSTKTHLIFLQKKTEEEMRREKEYDIFMAIAENVGHDSKGKPVWKEENNKKIINDDFPMIAEKYDEFRKGKLTSKNFDRYGYVVSSSWLENNLIARRYLPKYINVLNELHKLEKEGKVELKTLNEIKSKMFTGANIGAEDYVEDSPYQYIMTDCVTEFGIHPSNLKHVTKKSYEKNQSKAVKKNDIIINRTGSAGVAITIPKDMEGIMSCGFVFLLRLKSQYDPHYVVSFLNNRLGKLQTERCAFGSLLEHITKDDLENVMIAFPKDEKILNKIILESKEIEENQMKARTALQTIHNVFEHITSK